MSSAAASVPDVLHSDIPDFGCFSCRSNCFPQGFWPESIRDSSGVEIDFCQGQFQSLTGREMRYSY